MGIIDGTPTALTGPEKDALVLEASTIFSSQYKFPTIELENIESSCI